MIAQQLTPTSKHLPSVTADRLTTLAELYRQGQASMLIDRTVDKILAYEAERCQAQLDTVRHDLAEFEQRYGYSSSDFFARFQVGQTDDRMDYVEWASLVQMANRLAQRLSLLKGEAIA